MCDATVNARLAPESEEDYEVARSELKKRFTQGLAVAGIEPHGDDGEAPIHYGWAYVDGHLTRWTRQDLDEIYLELHPAKVMVEDDDLDEVLEEAKDFIGFLDGTGPRPGRHRVRDAITWHRTSPSSSLRSLDRQAVRKRRQGWRCSRHEQVRAPTDQSGEPNFLATRVGLARPEDRPESKRVFQI
jgi:hypothetical protein